MIAFLTLVYVGLLAILIKLKVIRLTLWWKLSPLAWMLLLLIVLFIPMQWGAPSGPVVVFRYVVEVIPNVTGQVIEVPAKPLVSMQKDDVLFRIDPDTFQFELDRMRATLDEAKASKDLARVQYDRTAEAAKTSAVAQSQVDEWRARLDAAVARIASVNAARVDESDFIGLLRGFVGSSGRAVGGLTNAILSASLAQKETALLDESIAV